MPHWNSIDLSDIRYKKVNTSKMSDKLDNNEVAKKENNYDCMIRIEVKRCAKLVRWNSYLFLLCDAYNKRKTVKECLWHRKKLCYGSCLSTKCNFQYIKEAI